MDLKKAYDAIDRDRCLKILRDVGVGEKTTRLISRFWRDRILVWGGGILRTDLQGAERRDTGETTIPNHL